jgi:carboxypeptidase PM20D1
MKRVLTGIALLLAALIAVLLVRTWSTRPAAVSVQPFAPALDADAMAKRLAAAIAIPTISEAGQPPAIAHFATLHTLLEREYPRVHATLARETINEGALLYRWAGREDCPAALFAAHQDVVPIEPGTEKDWNHAPFGEIADGAVWGRGAIDDKAALLGLMEAAEFLLAQGFTPRCPVYFAFGHDEEIGGRLGAAAIAARLAERDVELSFVLDEGGAITEGTVPGVAVPVATIGIAEKGYVSVRLIARGSGGHSSMPPQRTAIGSLARAVLRLEENRPEADFGPVQRELLQRIAPYVGFGQRLALSNLWLTAPLVESMLAARPATDATLRTTTAPTMFDAGVKDNVLPQQAQAVVNFRIRPGDSVAGVLEHVRATVDDASIEIAPLDSFSSEPTAPAAWDDPAFLAIERALRRVSPEPQMIVAPYVTNGATDARHYAALTPRLFRLLPVKLAPELMGSFHGTDERMPVDEYVRAVRFYIALLGDLDAAR